MRILPDGAVADLLSLDALLPVVEDAFRRQGRSAVERPERPHFPVGTDDDGNDPAGTGLVMPAYLHGEATYATKLVSVHEANPPDRPTVQAQVAVTDAATGDPLALVAGERVTNARTGCIGGLTARDLAVGSGPVTLGVVGAGQQARWQTRAIDAARGVATARIFSPSDSRERCAAELRERGIDAEAVGSARAAVSDADVVVTATTATEPVFPADALADGTLVVAVGAYSPEMQELDAAVLDRAPRVFADVPEEATETGDLLAAGVDDPVALSEVFEGRTGRESADEMLVVESVGSAVLDAATAAHLCERAEKTDAGETVAF
ncbi:ornithine cyclodeaminase family protein [Halorarius halobius]|uniref:ornithine cyclodeaminase family protein n=1 Tax=Halorarius halobius TaxID=2962671 RepID=UPI0020CF0FD3|nr:ornithine cyclodeaminase family protein [Halorarius halobius]